MPNSAGLRATLSSPHVVRSKIWSCSFYVADRLL